MRKVYAKNLEIIDRTDEAKEAMEEAVLRALTAIGLEAERDVKEKITEPKMHKWGDELHPKMRGSVDSGLLRNSITNKVSPGEQCVHVGTNVEYAPYVEYGTSRAPAYPFLKNTIQENHGKYMDIAKDYLKGKI